MISKSNFRKFSFLSLSFFFFLTFFTQIEYRYDDYEDDDENESVTDVNDDEDAFAIDKVARFNSKKLAAAAAAAANKKTPNNSNNKPISQITNKRAWELSVNECNSDYSSLYSVNKQSYCQNYIDNNIDSTVNNSKSKVSVGGSLLNNNNNNNMNDLANKTMAGEEFENNFETESEIARKVTPPGQILATINKWADKTKEAIDKRNKSIIKKKNF